VILAVQQVQLDYLDKMDSLEVKVPLGQLVLEG
jgi:hypothetical protein